MPPTFQIKVLLAEILFVTWDVRAFPISEVNPQHISSSCNDLHHCRTIWNIIWNSLVTIFACTWVAVHPNIPDPDPKRAKAKFWVHRLMIMVITLIVPELVIIWAMRQWLFVFRKATKGPPVSKAIIFFALMGGFMDDQEERLYLDEENRFYKLDAQGEKHVLDLRLSDLGLVDADIEDKSKSGFLSKGFAVVQTSWFLLQCVMRVVQRLPVTELEITTFAFAALNATIYVLWWNKPLAVERPIYVHKRPSNVTKPSIKTGLLDKIVTFFDQPPMKSILERMGKVQKSVLADQLASLDWLLRRDWVHPFASPVFEMVGLPWPRNMPVLHDFYAGEGEMIQELPYIAPAAGWVALVFGAIHCIAWRFQFPSDVEQVLWRSCAAVITCIPLFYVVLGFIVLLIYLFAEPRNLRYDCWGLLRKILMFAFTFVLGLTGFVYVLARIILVASAVVSLRSLPPGAFQTVRWANYIPHI